ncbi:MAG: PDZ domain-containing protein [Planctomycetes bacterium]|nr:PDZ domain-containing protein [Planctomycetota bacterium]
MTPVKIVLLMLLLQPYLFAADPTSFANHYLKSQANKDGPDFIQHKKAGPGWFSNLGPTGIRALLTDENGKAEWEGQGSRYLVKYVFPKSPASRKITPGDIILGVNGERFKSTYTFGYWFGWGYDGPITEVGAEVERAEKENKGRMNFLVLRKGKEIEVNITIKKKGVFTENFPYKCKKSSALKKEALLWLLKNQKADGKWPGQGHASMIACLALLAQGKRYLSSVDKHLKNIEFNDHTWNWSLAIYGIIMSEYTLMTRKKTYYKKMQQINDYFVSNQKRFKNSAFGHEGKSGSQGYGPMSSITGLVCLSWALLEKCKIKINQEAYMKTLITMDMELVRNDGDSKSGDFGYGWPNKGVKVYDFKPEQVTPALGELEADIENFNQDRAAGIPKAMMAITHSIRPWQDYSANVATHHINKITKTRRCLVTGHGSGIMHAWACFLALGQASNLGNSKPLQLSLEANKNLINSARCFDGSFYTQPQRDDFGGDLNRGSRTTATAMWLTMLSIPEKELIILGK